MPTYRVDFLSRLCYNRKAHLHTEEIMIITFCGHGDFRATPDLEDKLLLVLEREIGDSAAELFLGGYGNFDAFALRCGRILQRKHPRISLVYVTPYMIADPTGDKRAGYDQILYPPLENVPPRYAIVHRNRYMVERADMVIVYITRSRGGAYQAYQYATRKKKTIGNLAEP